MSDITSVEPALSEAQVAEYFDTAGAKAPEPAATTTPPAAPEGGEQQKERFVPHQALHEERERRKALEKDLQAEREKQARLDERLTILQRAWQQPDGTAQQPAGPPDIDSDARGYVQHLGQTLTKIEQTLQERQQAEAQQSQTRELVNWAAQQEREIVSRVPDYVDASRFLIEHRVSEYRALGFTDQQIQSALQADMTAVAMHARQTGANVAERIYAVAKHRGYQPKAPAAQPVEEQAQMINRGQQLASTPAAGGAPGGQITAAQLADMSAEEFDALARKDPKLVRRLMGG